MTKKKEQQQKLLDIIKDAIDRDKQLREKYNIGEKFRFIQDRLNTFFTKLEADIQAMMEQEKKASQEAPQDEVLVHIYLFNAHGLDLRSWQKMVTPKIMYEHSINRPVYLEKSQVEAFIRSKKTKPQHGFITIGIKRADILQSDSAKDAIGQPVAKIKEGSLRFERLVSFDHNDHVYVLNEDGELVRKG